MRTGAPKIFGIGLSKTGTTSLAHALEMLGYRTKDYLGVTQYSRGDLSSIDLDVLDENDAFTDTPIPSFYRELDARHPNSKFILTVRSRDRWLKSCKKQFTQRLSEKQGEAHKCLFEDLYGTDVFDEQKFVNGYDRFVRGVLEHFKDRPNDLLVIDIAAGEGWDKLCRFLQKPVPEAPFPKANVTQVRWINMTDLVELATLAGQEILEVHGQRRPTQGSRDVERSTENVAITIRKRQVRPIFALAIQALLGGDKAALRRAAKRANKVIVKRLKTLTPQIAVLSRLDDDLPYSQRASWNHLWLVDPLNATRVSSQTGNALTVSIALIEDGKPICGVVYAPLAETCYYAKVGSGSFKMARDAPPQKLSTFQSGTSDATCTKDRSRPQREIENCSAQTLGDCAAPSAAPALAMCMLAEGKLDAYRCEEHTMEWEIAAAHVVAACVGKKVYVCDSKEKLLYNKKSLVNECFSVE